MKVSPNNDCSGAATNNAAKSWTSQCSSETNSLVEGETGADDDDHNIRRFSLSKKKVWFMNEKIPNSDVPVANGGANSNLFQSNSNRFFSNVTAGGNGASNGIMRSVSMSTALDDIHVCKTCNIKERLGRTRRHLKPSVKRSFSRKELLSIFALGFIDFVGFCSMSVMAPFFPNEAAQKGMDVSHAGYVFSFYALIMFITAPIFGKILPHVGTRFMFLAGIFVTGSCNILFGVLALIQNNAQFAFFCFLVRGLEALGAGGFSTASFVYIIHLFPDNISAVLGVMETFAGLGMSIGPALGGLLYSVGGFELPFYALGFCMVASTPFYYFLLPPLHGSPSNKPSGSVWRMITIPSVFVIFLVIVVISNAWSFLDPTLEPHLRTLKLSSQHTGLVFLCFSAVYAVFSPLWGWIGDKYNNHWGMMAAGLFFTSVSLMLLGPSPIIPHIVNTLWLNMVALCTLSTAVALALAPTFKALIECAVAKGFQESISTYSVVAGIWSCAYSLGDMTGPTLGGILLEHFGFPVCTTTMAIISLFMAAICILYFGLIEDYPKKSDYSFLHPLLMKDKLAYYEALSNDSDAITITLTNAGACEV